MYNSTSPTLENILGNFSKMHPNIKFTAETEIYTKAAYFDLPIKMCLEKTCSKVCIGKNLSHISYSEWSKTRRLLAPLLFSPRKLGRAGIE
jgi:hypothetical protein